VVTRRGESVTPKAAPTPRVQSFRSYARHRGVSAPSVLRAIKGRRLNTSVARDGSGKALGITDFAIADAEWDANTDLSKAPGYVKVRAGSRQPSTASALAPTKADAPVTPPVTPELVEADAGDGIGPRNLSLLDASALEKDWRARLLELEYRQKTGELVDRKTIEAKVFDLFTHCRTKLLALPVKAKAALPQLTRADIAVLERIMREALEELAPPAQKEAAA
jgi:hypothetical protein